jgi:hypothetical protein
LTTLGSQEAARACLASVLAQRAEDSEAPPLPKTLAALSLLVREGRVSKADSPDEQARALWAALSQQCEDLARSPLPRFARRLYLDHDQRALWMARTEPSFEQVSPRDVTFWNRVLFALYRVPWLVDQGRLWETARRFAQRLPAARLVQSWAAGAAPVSLAPAALPGLPGFRLRYLDKRRDIFDFLRFADAAPCCFSSNSRDYLRGRQTMHEIVALWFDPLSYVFLIERQQPDAAWSPFGFVLGGYGLRGWEPALLLNGVYAQRQSSSLRAAVLSVVEEEFARPLGVQSIGIANRNGGSGPLPPHYALQHREGPFVWLRALVSPGGGEVSRAYCDLGSRVNTQISGRWHLYWTSLSLRKGAPLR